MSIFIKRRRVKPTAWLYGGIRMGHAKLLRAERGSFVSESLLLRKKYRDILFI